MESYNNSTEIFCLYNDLTSATKDNDKEEKNITVYELEYFFANNGEKLAKIFNTLNELRVKKEVSSMFSANTTKIETKKLIESLKTTFGLVTYRLNQYRLKIDKIEPLLKEGNDLDPSYHRQFSLLPVLSKFFERVLSYRMNQHITKFQLLQNSQFRFKPKRNTIDALKAIIEEKRQDWNSKTTKTQCKFNDLKKPLIQLTTCFYSRKHDA